MNDNLGPQFDEAMSRKFDSFTGMPYVDVDFTGVTSSCHDCGNDAPARPRTDALSTKRPKEKRRLCNLCFQGRREMAKERRKK